MAIAENWQAGALAQIGSLVAEIETLRAALSESEHARLELITKIEELEKSKEEPSGGTPPTT